MLTNFITTNKDLQLLQNNWIKQINPILAIPMLSGISLPNITLKTGNNTINHLLGRQMQGWFITDQDTSASIYRSESFNNLTLTLHSSAPTNINLWVF